MRIFISYGHDEHLSFARQLAEAFRTRNYEVWFDETYLTGGVPWEEYIEKGLRWVAQDEDGRMILVMTPHSVRRPDGYCLNELAYALDLHMPVLPIMLVWTTPPLSIYRYQWIDLTHHNGGGVSFTEDFEKIIKAIEAESIPDFEDSYYIKRHLDPLDYSNDMVLYQPSFVGRRWLFDDFKRWITDSDAGRVYFLTGSPGIGKTAIAVNFIQTCENVMAFHLFHRGHSEKTSTRRVICSLAYQIAQQLPDYRQRLLTIDLALELDRCNDVALFDVLLSTPLLSCQVPQTPKLILIDALDEAGDNLSVPFAGFLSRTIGKLPNWIRIVITSRPVESVLYPLQQFSPYFITADSADNLADLNEYVDKRLRKIYGDIAPDGSAIVKRSEGIFLYAKYVFDELLPTSASDFDENALPQGIGAIYYNFFLEHYCDLPNYRSNIRPILEVISAQVEPFTLDMLSTCIGVESDCLEDFVSVFHSFFFLDAEQKIRPYHSSIVEWLSNKRLSGQFAVNTKKGTDVIAMWLYKIFQDSGWNFFIDGEKGQLLQIWLPQILERTSILVFETETILKSYLTQVSNKGILKDLVSDKRRFHLIKIVLSYIFKRNSPSADVIDNVYECVLEEISEDKRSSPYLEKHIKGLKYLYEFSVFGYVTEPPLTSALNEYYYFVDVQLPLFYAKSSFDSDYTFKALAYGLISAFEDGRVATLYGILNDIYELASGPFADSGHVAIKHLEEVADRMDEEGWDDGMWANRARACARSIKNKTSR